MNRVELLQAWSYELNKADTLDSRTQARALAYMNMRHRSLLSSPGLQHVRDTVTVVGSEAGRALYGLKNLAKVNRIWSETDNRLLSGMSLADYRAVAPRAKLESGSPTHWVWIGYGAVERQPAGLINELFVQSTQAADTTQTIHLEGLDVGNNRWGRSVLLNGITPVSLGVWLRVDKFYASASTVGFVGLHDGSGGPVLASLWPQMYARYYQFYLWPTPASAQTYSVDATHEIVDFLSDADEPMLPASFHDLIWLGAVVDELRHLDDSRYAVAANEYLRREREFRYWCHETASAQMGPRDRPSQLGSQFAAGT